MHACRQQSSDDACRLLNPPGAAPRHRQKRRRPAGTIRPGSTHQRPRRMMAWVTGGWVAARVEWERDGSDFVIGSAGQTNGAHNRPPGPGALSSASEIREQCSKKQEARSEKKPKPREEETEKGDVCCGWDTVRPISGHHTRKPSPARSNQRSIGLEIAPESVMVVGCVCNVSGNGSIMTMMMMCSNATPIHAAPRFDSYISAYD